jgi:nickel-dependent lactate racemase
MDTATGKVKSDIVGFGSPDALLGLDELRRIVEDALVEIHAGDKVLAIVPDKTRDDNTDILFPFAAQFLKERGIEKLDVLIAQGTHVPMTADEKREKIGIGNGEMLGDLGRVFDHHWSDPAELYQIGELAAKDVAELTNGLYANSIPLTLNRLLAPGNYDCVLIFGRRCRTRSLVLREGQSTFSRVSPDRS